MAQTFQQLQQQIEALKAQAEGLRQKEVQGVIANIKTAIEAYGISEQDLFAGGQTSRAKQSRSPGRQAGAKYSDGKGNSWVGIGKRPRWLQEALAAGSKLEDFLGKLGIEAGFARGAGANRRTKKSSQGGRKAQYRDAAGNVWSGRGPRLRWFKEALAGGKTLEELHS